jgi:hypothetical protein
MKLPNWLTKLIDALRPEPLPRIDYMQWMECSTTTECHPEHGCPYTGCNVPEGQCSGECMTKEKK